MLMFASLMNALMSDWEKPACYDEMGIVSVVLVSALAMNAILGFALCLLTAFLWRTRAQLHYSRVYLGRFMVLTQTSNNQVLFGLTHLMDAFSAFILLMELIYLPTALAYCHDTFLIFYGLAMLFQCNFFIRLFLFCVHYKSASKPFYKWLKRKFPLLATVEAEQRLVLDVWRLEQYVAKLQAELEAIKTKTRTRSNINLCRTVSQGSA